MTKQSAGVGVVCLALGLGVGFFLGSADEGASQPETRSETPEPSAKTPANRTALQDDVEPSTTPSERTAKTGESAEEEKSAPADLESAQRRIARLKRELRVAKKRAAPPSRDPGDSKPGQLTVTLFANGMALGEVAAEISRQTGQRVEVDPRSKDLPVHLKFEGTPWRLAVERTAVHTQCDVEQRPEDVLFLSKPPMVSFEAKQADARELVRRVAKKGGANIVFHPDFKGTVDLSFNDVHWLRALHTIVKTSGDYEVIQETENMLRVVPTAALEPQVETRVFKLVHTRKLSEIDEARRLMDVAFAQIRKAYKDSPEVALHYDAGARAFVITGTRPMLHRARKIIAKLDEPR